METRNDVRAMIYNLSGGILMGKTDEKEIARVYKLAKEHNLMYLVKEELQSLNLAICGEQND